MPLDRFEAGTAPVESSLVVVELSSVVTALVVVVLLAAVWVFEAAPRPLPRVDGPAHELDRLS